MSGRIVTHPTGRKIHVGGRLIPRFAHGLKLHSPRYGLNLSQWPATPDVTTWGDLPAAQSVLADILGNDQYGCCTESDQYHRQAIRQAAAGSPVFNVNVSDVLATYSRDGGFDPNNPQATDNGCDETVVLTNACTQGIVTGGGVDIAAGYVQIDETNAALVKAVVAMFPGGVPICMSLPNSYIQIAQAPGFVWAMPTDPWDPNNGHCFTLLDYSKTDLGIGTWGMKSRLTLDALAAGCSTGNGGALYLECDNEILSAMSKLAPDGLDWATLIDDFNSIGGNVPAPAPAPGPVPPAPPPIPPAAVTLSLDEVQQLLATSWPTT